MPTVSGSGNEEVESQDEVKVFKYEGEEEESEKSSSENLKEDKSSLITETEEVRNETLIAGAQRPLTCHLQRWLEKNSHVPSSSYASASSNKSDGRLPDTPPFGLFGTSAWGADRLGYLSPFAYAYTNGSAAMTAKDMGLGAGSAGGSLFSLYHNGQAHLGQPPPAHMGISPYQLDKSGYEGRLPVFSDYSVSVAGLRPPVYPFPTSGQYPYPLTADFTAQMASAWFTPSGLMPPHPGLTPPLSHSLVSSPKSELPNTSHENHRHPSLNDQKNNLNSNEKSQMIETKNGEKKPHIKKPLNAFMLYMKEMRAKVVAECTLKESAAINQILGRKWHALSREEQAKYYEMARKERQLHMQMYPGWSSRQNYSQGKKKKRNRDKNQDGANMKKCRARYGLEQQSQWCKPCRRKKKCIRYMEGEDHEEMAPGSTGSQEGTMSQDSDSEDDVFSDVNISLNNSLNSSLQTSSPTTLLDRGLPSPASSSNLILSPGPSLASPLGPASLLMPSPASLASPLTPGEHSRDIFPLPSFGVPPLPPTRPPVGTNPRDINNPLSVNQLTGQCSTNKTEVPNQEGSRPAMVSVT